MKTSLNLICAVFLLDFLTTRSLGADDKVFACDEKSILQVQDFQQKNPCSTDTLSYQNQILSCRIQSQKIPDKTRLLSDVSKLREIFKALNACPQSSQSAVPDSIQVTLKQAEGLLAPLAAAWAQEANLVYSPEIGSQAAVLLGLFLELFPESAQSYNLRFIYAELLRTNLHQMDQATMQYQSIVDADLLYLKDKKEFPKGERDGNLPSPPGTHLCESAYWAAMPPLEPEKQKKTAKELIDKAQVYLTNCPHHSGACSLKLELGKALCQMKHVGEAQRWLNQVILKCPHQSMKERAEMLLFEMLDKAGKP